MALAERDHRLAPLDQALFAVMAALPLLPTGPEYLGLEPAPFLDAALVALAALLVVQIAGGRAARQRRGDRGDPDSPAPDPTRDQAPEPRHDPVPDPTLDPTRERRHAPAPDPAPGRPAGLERIRAAWLLFAAAATGAALVGIAAENLLDSPVFRYQLAGLGRLLGPVDRMAEPLLSLSAWFVVVRGLLAYALVGLLVGGAPDPERRRRAALAGWLCGFGAVAAFAVGQYLTGYRLHPFWVEVNPLLTRSHATLDDPNALGSYLALGIFVCAGCAAARRLAPRWVTATLALLGAAALLASGSRAALGAVLVVGLWAAVRRSRLRRAAGWALAAVLLIVAVSLLSRLFVPVTLTDYRPDNVAAAVVGSLDPRVSLPQVLESRGTWWSAALGMWRDHPILGVGLARFPRLLSTYSEGFAAGLDAHSYFLQVAAEAGALGLVSLLLLLAAVFTRLRAAAAGEPGFGVADGALFGSVAFVATFATGHPLLLTSGQVLWASLLAVVVAGRPVMPDRRRRRVPAAWVAVACAAIIGIYALGAARVPGPASDGPWGYAYGLYPEEADDGGTFRWTGPLALVQLERPAGAEALVAEIVVSPALRSGEPTEVRFFLSRRGSVGDEFTPADFVVRRVTEDGAVAAALELPAAPTGSAGGSGDVLLRIEVSPAFVPAAGGGSDDRRQLGVRLRPLRFSGSR